MPGRCLIAGGGQPGTPLWPLHVTLRTAPQCGPPPLLQRNPCPAPRPRHAHPPPLKFHQRFPPLQNAIHPISLPMPRDPAPRAPPPSVTLNRCLVAALGCNPLPPSGAFGSWTLQKGRMKGCMLDTKQAGSASARAALSPRPPLIYSQGRGLLLRLDPRACHLPVLLQPARVGRYALLCSRRVARVHLHPQLSWGNKERKGRGAQGQRCCVHTLPAAATPLQQPAGRPAGWQPPAPEHPGSGHR